jgi:hypothetical protein
MFAGLPDPITVDYDLASEYLFPVPLQSVKLSASKVKRTFSCKPRPY